MNEGINLLFLFVLLYFSLFVPVFLTLAQGKSTVWNYFFFVNMYDIHDTRGSVCPGNKDSFKAILILPMGVAPGLTKP